MTDGTSPATDDVLVRCPTWCCRCGTDGNFCSRGQCRNCGATAPVRIRKLALDEISKRKKQNKQNNCKSHAKGDALAKGQSRCQQVSLQRHQLLKSLLQPQTMESFVSVLIHCEPCRIQLINSWLRCQAGRNAIGSSGPAAGHHDREKEAFVDLLEATHRDLSQFMQHLQTLLQNTELGQVQAERSEVVEGSSSSGKQDAIELLLRRALHQPNETLSQHMEVVVRAAAASRFAGGSGGRRMSEKVAHSQATKQAQSVALDASLNVAASASSLQTSRHGVAGDTILSGSCLAWLSFRSITWLTLTALPKRRLG